MFKELGAMVLDADELAREVVQPGRPAWRELRRTFGADYFREDGSLDREKLGRLVFQDPEARRRLNGAVHPRIIREMARRLAELERQGVPLVLVEVPLLFEAGLAEKYDKIIVVDATPEEQLKRLAARDGRSPEEAAGILGAQWPLSLKRARADYVVDNRGSLAETEGQVKKLWQELKNQLDKDSQKS
jgi:dephospho-CoA kinase